MGQISVAMLAIYYSKEAAGKVERLILLTRWQKGGSVLGRKRYALMENVGSWTADRTKWYWT